MHILGQEVLHSCAGKVHERVQIAVQKMLKGPRFCNQICSWQTWRFSAALQIQRDSIAKNPGFPHFSSGCVFQVRRNMCTFGMFMLPHLPKI